MKNKRFMKNNEGYTLVELIIVLAIIAILSAAAMITLHAINVAKAKEASTTFKIQVDALSARAKSELAWVDLDDDGKYDSGEEYVGGVPANGQYVFSLKLYKSGSKLYVKPSAAKLLPNGDFDVAGVSDVSLGVTSDSDKGASLSAYVDIKYTSEFGTHTIDSGTKANIVFDRSGNCVKGVGKYEFYSKKGGLISTVTINKNGSIQIK